MVNGDSEQEMSVLNKIEDCGEVYHFRRPLTLSVYPVHSQNHVHLGSLDLGIDGQGRTCDEAVEDFKKNFLKTYKHLASFFPHQRSPEGEAQYRRINGVLDIERMERERPVDFTSLGEVAVLGDNLTIKIWGEEDTFELDRKKLKGAPDNLAVGDLVNVRYTAPSRDARPTIIEGSYINPDQNPAPSSRQ